MTMPKLGQYQQVADLYHKDMPSTRIAEELGLSYQQVLYALKVLDLPRKHLHVTACMKNDELVRSLAAKGKSLSEIGRRVGAKGEDVRVYLDRYQIPYTPWDPTIPENNGQWTGGRILEKKEGKPSYWLVKSPDHPHRNRHGYVREHRLVAEQVLGRFLEPEEVVHHKDGDTMNNDPSNLEVFPNNAEHLRHTLKGKVPNYTPEGKQRMIESARRPRPRRRNPNLSQ